MPIDTTQGSVGWWMLRLSRQLNADRRRFDLLENYATGQPPLPWGSEDVKSRFYRFQRASRTNYGALITEAMSERVGIRSVTTAVDSDSDGDPIAWRLVLGNDLDVVFPTMAQMAYKFGRAYITAAMPDDSGRSVITVEDPREMIAETGPGGARDVRALFKLFHDSAASLDVAVLWLPDGKHVATRPSTRSILRRSNGIVGVPVLPRLSFSPTAFTLQPERPEGVEGGYWSEVYDKPRPIPGREVRNRDGIGEFELHLDLLDRLNHLVFALMVIVTIQAFRQRGMKQSTDPAVPQLPEFDESGQKIDYNEIFEAGPDALWILPPGVDVWESQQADVNGILNAIRADLLKLSAVTRTPMSVFTPDAATQTAEGAELQREGQTHKIRQFLRGAGRDLAFILATGFDFMDDADRSDPATVTVNFLPVNEYSLSEKGMATSQAAGTLPFEDILDQIWQMSPDQIALAMTHRSADQFAAGLAAPTTPGAAPGDPLTLGEKATAFGELIRSGVTPESAAAQAGLAGVEVRPDLRPVTLRPTTEPSSGNPAA